MTHSHAESNPATTRYSAISPINSDAGTTDGGPHSKILPTDTDSVDKLYPISIFAGKRGTKPNVVDVVWAGLVQHLRDHKEFPSKDAVPAFIPGKTSVRSNKAIESISALVVDIDGKQSANEVRQILTGLGYRAWLYSTFNHLQEEIFVTVAAFQKFRKTPKDEEPTVEEVTAYLASVDKDYVHVLSIKSETVKHDGKESIVVRCQPLHKMRVLFLLQKPFVFSQDEAIHAQQVELWKIIYKSVCGKLGFDFDASCQDPARLYFWPSRPVGGEYVNEVFHNDGPLLDLTNYHNLTLDDVKNSRPVKKSSAKKTSTATAAIVSHDGFPLKVWAAKYAATFQIVAALENSNPDLLGSPAFGGEGVHLTECPFIAEHNSPQGTKTAIKDGDGDEGFKITCHGAGCKKQNDGNGRDRLDYIAKMLEDEWLTVEDLQNEDFGGGPVSDDAGLEEFKQELSAQISNTGPSASDQEKKKQKQAKKRLKRMRKSIQKRIDACDRNTKSDEIEPIIYDGIKHESVGRQKEILRELHEKTGWTLGDLRETEKGQRNKTKADKKELLRKKTEVSRKDGYVKRGKIYWIGDTYSTALRVGFALGDRLEKCPTLFHYLDGYARVRMNASTGGLGIQTLDRGMLEYEINRHIKFMTYNDAGVEHPTPVPEAVAKHLFKSPDLPFPVLTGVKTTPFFDADGQLVVQKGYDHQSGVYLDPPMNLKVPDISPNPTGRDIARAKSLLHEVFGEFPFHDEGDGIGASYAHMIALSLQPFVREMIDGPTPIFFVQKTTPGTGASLINDVRNDICYGFQIGGMAVPTTDEEFAKKVDAKLIESAPVIFFDNIQEKIDDANLALATTAVVHSARVLGASKTVDVRVKCDWVMAGNNVGVGKQFARRVMLINLDAQSIDPTKGRTFAHPALRVWVKSNRSELIWACLTLIQAWIAAGKPLGETKIASYESWSTVMGGIFDVIGINGLLKNLDAVSESVDDTEQQLPAFFAYWLDQWGDKEVNIGRLANDEENGGTNYTHTAKTILDLYNMVADDIELGFGAYQKKSWQSAMGKVLSNVNGRHFKVTSNKDGSQNEIRLKIRRTNSKTKYQLVRIKTLEGNDCASGMLSDGCVGEKPVLLKRETRRRGALV